jgi:dTDP-4-amino-4,6-dideoxygalactose transaminase
MRVPFLDLTRQYESVRAEIDAAIHRVVVGQRFILGPEVEALEQDIATYCQARFAVGCASGSDALLLALMALGVEAGDQVLCPSYTFFATAGAISRLGARPVFADIDPSTYNVAPEAARRAADSCDHLKALIPVHLFGRACDVDSFLALGEELGVPVVEDAAQAIGAEDARGRRCGSRGAVGCFSFFPSKNLGGYGDGGMVTTDDETLAERMRVLRVHGAKPKYYHRVVGMNSRLDALQAAIIRVKLGQLDTWTESRQRHAATYDAAFRDAGARVSGEPEEAGRLPIAIPRPAPSAARHVYNQYVIRVPGAVRDDLRIHLREREIGSEVYYPLGLHEQGCFAELGYRRGDLPETERAAAETLALPIFPELSEDQQTLVISAVLEFLSGG